jgi:hypothetical protein
MDAVSCVAWRARGQGGVESSLLFPPLSKANGKVIGPTVKVSNVAFLMHGQVSGTSTPGLLLRVLRG